MSALALLWTYRRWVAYAAIAIAIALFAWRVNAWHKGYLEKDAAVAHAKAVEAQAAKTLAQLQERFDNAQKASKGYQDDLAKARADRAARRDLPARSVRLCQPAPVRSAATGAGGPDAAATAPAEPSGQAGPDIGRELYDLTDDGDEREAALRAQIIRLQELLRE